MQIGVPSCNFIMMEPSWTKVQEVVKVVRTGSASGPSDVPYTTGLQIFPHLWKILMVIWRRGYVAS